MIVKPCLGCQGKVMMYQKYLHIPIPRTLTASKVWDQICYLSKERIKKMYIDNEIWFNNKEWIYIMMMTTKRDRHIQGQIPMLRHSLMPFALFSTEACYQWSMHRSMPLYCFKCCTLMWSMLMQGLTLVLTCIASLHKAPNVLLFEEGTVLEMTVVISFSASGITSFSVMSSLYLFWLCTNRNEKTNM